jgi:hypothetical protein
MHIDFISFIKLGGQIHEDHILLLKEIRIRGVTFFKL